MVIGGEDMEQLSNEELLFLSNLMHIKEEGEYEKEKYIFSNIWTNDN